jgi:hypothetical protein
VQSVYYLRNTFIVKTGDKCKAFIICEIRLLSVLILFIPAIFVGIYLLSVFVLSINHTCFIEFVYFIRYICFIKRIYFFLSLHIVILFLVFTYI